MSQDFLQRLDEFRVYCYNCNRYTKHFDDEGKTPIDYTISCLGHKTYRCDLCNTVPTPYNFQFTLELIREYNHGESLHPKFISPMFRYGQVCLIRDQTNRAYAHCKIYGMRYIPNEDIDKYASFEWEYYVIIHGKKDYQWINERKLYNVKSPIF